MKNPTTRARSGSPVTIVPSRSGRSRRVQPTSCDTDIAAVSSAVARRPNSAQPAQSIALVTRELARLRVERAQDTLERLVEARDALGLECGTDCIHVDPDCAEAAQDLARNVDIGVERAAHLAV